MIKDNQLVFFDGEAVTAGLKSKVVSNFVEGEATGKKQDAYKQLFLQAKSTAATGDIILKLETAEDSDFTTGVKPLGSYVLEPTGKVLTRLPIGALGFLRLTADGSDGTLKAAIVVDVDVQ
jgi:hypothetical protein